MDQDIITAIAATATALRTALQERGAAAEASSWVAASMAAIVAYETSVIRYAPAADTESEAQHAAAVAREQAIRVANWTVLREPPADEPGQLWDIGRPDDDSDPPVTLVRTRGASYARLCNELAIAGPGELVFRRYVPDDDLINRRIQ